jgi:hypothetical protein
MWQRPEVCEVEAMAISSGWGLPRLFPALLPVKRLAVVISNGTVFLVKRFKVC